MVECFEDPEFAKERVLSEVKGKQPSIVFLDAPVTPSPIADVGFRAISDIFKVRRESSQTVPTKSWSGELVVPGRQEKRDGLPRTRLVRII